MLATVLTSAGAFHPIGLRTAGSRSSLVRMVTEAPEAPVVDESSSFAIGDRVECNLGDKWAVGKVIDTSYVTQDGDTMPYRIKLRNGKNVLAQTEAAVREAGFLSELKEMLSPANVKEDEMQATFFSVDTDGSQSIDADELSDALDSFGYALPKNRVEDLLLQYGTNRELTYAQFKVLMGNLSEGDSTVSIKRQPGMAKAMDLFREYDKDRSGSIDKYEFKAIAAKMNEEQQQATRASFLAGLALAGGVEYVLLTQDLTALGLGSLGA